MDSGKIGGLMFRSKIRLNELDLFRLGEDGLDVDQQVDLFAVLDDTDEQLAADAAHEGRGREEGLGR
jgi:hypothetical protein